MSIDDPRKGLTIIWDNHVICDENGIVGKKLSEYEYDNISFTVGFRQVLSSFFRLSPGHMQVVISRDRYKEGP